VVIDEIKSAKDSPSEMIYDEFGELLFPGDPRGRRALGTIQSIGRLDVATVTRFSERNYHPERMVLSSVGNISFDRFVAYAEKYFGDISPRRVPFAPAERTSPQACFAFKKEVVKRNHQSHCIIGTACDSSTREFRIGMAMLSHLLGGNGMNTRLNMSLRERNGWVYHVEAAYTPYSDVGVFNVYFATDKTKIEKCVSQIEKELNRLKKEPLTAQQLKKLQLQILGQLAIASDSNDARMLSAGKSMLMFGRADNLNDICRTIDEIRSERLCEIANTVFADLSFLTYH